MSQRTEGKFVSGNSARLAQENWRRALKRRTRRGLRQRSRSEIREAVEEIRAEQAFARDRDRGRRLVGAPLAAYNRRQGLDVVAVRCACSDWCAADQICAGCFDRGWGELCRTEDCGRLTHRLVKWCEECFAAAHGRPRLPREQRRCCSWCAARGRLVELAPPGTASAAADHLCPEHQLEMDAFDAAFDDYNERRAAEWFAASRASAGGAR